MTGRQDDVNASLVMLELSVGTKFNNSGKSVRSLSEIARFVGRECMQHSAAADWFSLGSADRSADQYSRRQCAVALRLSENGLIANAVGVLRR
jgi:hypothetical protein